MRKSSKKTMPCGDSELERLEKKNITPSNAESVQCRFLRDEFASHEVGAVSNDKSLVSNKTGMPNKLKSGLENLSGYDLSSVRVHYNSPKPKQLGALAYAQGTNIHLGAGQDKHLPHEGWHVVQQMQGRVKPTVQMKGTSINDNSTLEREADVMGEKALQKESYSSDVLHHTISTQKQCSALNKNNGNNSKSLSGYMPAQLTISYARGGYKDQNELVNALCAIFDDEAHDSIRDWVQKYEDANGRALFASQVYQYVIGHLADVGYLPSFASTTTTSVSSHGPMIPDRVNRHAKPDLAKALSTFNFSSVTLGRLTMITGDDQISFQDRQIDANFHAEDGLMEQLEEFIGKNRVDTRQVRLNLTINNFFCSRSSTSKSKDSDNCLDEIIALHKKHKFASFHVYFQNAYGDRSQMTALIRKLQKAKILVSSFTTNETAPFANDELDLHSESEEEDIPKRSRKRERKTASSKRQRRDSFVMPDLHGTSLDDNRLFEDVPVQILSERIVSMNGYQVAELIRLFGEDVVGSYVHVGGVELRICQMRSPLPKTDYNPNGLALGLRRYLRGG